MENTLVYSTDSQEHEENLLDEAELQELQEGKIRDEVLWQEYWDDVHLDTFSDHEQDYMDQQHLDYDS